MHCCNCCDHDKGSLSFLFVQDDFQNPKLLSITNPRWTKLGLDPRIIDILSEKGITKFTPVQAEAFAPVIAGRHVIGRSRTGTGKTLAFGLPSMTRLVNIHLGNGTMDARGGLRRGRKVSMVILCPTRELARQVQEELAEVARPLGLHTEVFHGGVSYDPQSRALRDSLDILVGTPGRVIDHLNRGNLDLSECNIVVLDEAGEYWFCMKVKGKIHVL
jgi:ATP-dependent RNA helicase DDX21